LFNIRPFVSLQGIYDTGLSSLSVDANGNAAEANDYGVEGTFGVLGYQTWKRTTLGIDYRGNARHYSTHSFYDGFDNSLTLSVDHDVNRHWRLMFGQALASYSRNYYMPYGSSWLGVPDYAPPSFSNLAGHELFDGRTNALTSTGRAIYQATPRFSVSFGGSGVVVRRRSDSLAGMQGYSAGGDFAY
jgi:hypothetical protein